MKFFINISILIICLIEWSRANKAHISNANTNLISMQNGIFESLEKHRKMFRRKARGQADKAGVPSNAAIAPKADMNGKVDSVNDKSEVAKQSDLMKRVKALQKKQDGTMGLDLEVGNGPIFFSGWVKYFKYYQENGPKQPRTFFRNNHFYKQRKENLTLNLDEADADGEFKYIRNNTYFWGNLFKHSLTFSTDRIVIYILI